MVEWNDHLLSCLFVILKIQRNPIAKSRQVKGWNFFNRLNQTSPFHCFGIVHALDKELIIQQIMPFSFLPLCLCSHVFSCLEKTGVLSSYPQLQPLVPYHCRPLFLCEPFRVLKSQIFLQSLDRKYFLWQSSCCIVCLMCINQSDRSNILQTFQEKGCIFYVSICHNTEFMALHVIIAQQNSCHGTVNSWSEITIKQFINSPFRQTVLNRYLALNA